MGVKLERRLHFIFDNQAVVCIDFMMFNPFLCLYCELLPYLRLYLYPLVLRDRHAERRRRDHDWKADFVVGP